MGRDAELAWVSQNGLVFGLWLELWFPTPWLTHTYIQTLSDPLYMISSTEL